MGVLPITSKLLFLCKNLAKIISGPQSTLQNNKKEVHDPLIAPITMWFKCMVVVQPDMFVIGLHMQWLVWWC